MKPSAASVIPDRTAADCLLPHLIVFPPCRGGVLHITLPKAEHVKPKKVDISIT